MHSSCKREWQADILSLSERVCDFIVSYFNFIRIEKKIQQKNLKISFKSIGFYEEPYKRRSCLSKTYVKV